MQADHRQAASTVLMIRPANFGYNAETAVTNAFQNSQTSQDARQINAAAVAEFDDIAAQLRAQDVEVLVFDDRQAPRTPDAVFPNNWISLHADGRVVLYPMLTPSRRAEVRMDIVQALSARFGFDPQPLDLRQRFPDVALEGTGSLVFDHVNRTVYAALSPRTDKGAVRELSNLLRYEPILFRATDGKGMPLYHTNVMLTIGDRFAVVCLDSLGDAAERARVNRRLQETGHEVIDISREQMMNFAGNMLQLTNSRSESLLVMSETALACLRVDQKNTLASFSRIMPVRLPTIEFYGGGSIRCMLAEVFVPAL